MLLDPLVGQPLSPGWKRLVAIFLDGALLGVAYYMVFFIIITATHHASRTVTNPKPVNVAAVIGGTIQLIVIAALPATLDYAFMNGSTRGQTVGKLAMGIAVRDSRQVDGSESGGRLVVI